MNQKTYQVLLNDKVHAEWIGNGIPVRIAAMYNLEQSDLDDELPVIFKNGNGLHDVELRIKPEIASIQPFIGEIISFACGAKYIRYPNGKFRRLSAHLGNFYSNKEIQDLYDHQLGLIIF